MAVVNDPAGSIANLLASLPSGVGTVGYPALGAFNSNNPFPDPRYPGFYGAQWAGGGTPQNPNLVSGYPAMVGPTPDLPDPTHWAGPVSVSNPLTDPGFGPFPALLSPSPAAPGRTPVRRAAPPTPPVRPTAPIRAPVRPAAPPQNPNFTTVQYNVPGSPGAYSGASGGRTPALRAPIYTAAVLNGLFGQ